MRQQSPTDTADLLHGVEAIGAFLALTPRQAKHWIARHGVPTFKMGRTVCARRATLSTWLAKREASSLQG